MIDEFRIHPESLRGGKQHVLDAVQSADFMNVHEEGLSFSGEITIRGEAYTTEDELILHFSVDATACIPCSVCNKPVLVPVSLRDVYHAIPLSEIPHGVFNYASLLREEILLEVPRFAECHQGCCPEREMLKKYFKQSSSQNGPIVQQPFADLQRDEDN